MWAWTQDARASGPTHARVALVLTPGAGIGATDSKVIVEETQRELEARGVQFVHLGRSDEAFASCPEAGRFHCWTQLALEALRAPEAPRADVPSRLLVIGVHRLDDEWVLAGLEFDLGALQDLGPPGKEPAKREALIFDRTARPVRAQLPITGVVEQLVSLAAPDIPARPEADPEAAGLRVRGTWRRARSYALVVESSSQAAHRPNPATLAHQIEVRTGMVRASVSDEARTRLLACGADRECAAQATTSPELVIVIRAQAGELTTLRAFDVRTGGDYITTYTLKLGSADRLLAAVGRLFPSRFWDEMGIAHIRTGDVQAVAIVGAAQCQTPCSLRVARRLHELEVRADGFEPWKDALDLLYQPEVSVDVELEPTHDFRAIAAAEMGLGAGTVVRAGTENSAALYSTVGYLDARLGVSFLDTVYVGTRIGATYVDGGDAAYASPAFTIALGPGTLFKRDHFAVHATVALPGEKRGAQIMASTAAGRWDEHLWRSEAFALAWGAEFRLPGRYLDASMHLDFSKLIPENEIQDMDFVEGFGAQFAWSLSHTFGSVELRLRQQLCARSAIALIEPDGYWLLSHQASVQLRLHARHTLRLGLNFNTAAEPDLTGGLGSSLAWRFLPPD